MIHMRSSEDSEAAAQKPPCRAQCILTIATHPARPHSAAMESEDEPEHDARHEPGRSRYRVHLRNDC